MALTFFCYLALLINGTLFLPLAPVANLQQMSGEPMRYNAVTHTLTMPCVNDEQTRITLTLGSTTATVGDKTVTLDAAPFEVLGIFFMSQQTMSDVIGVKTSYDAKQGLVKIAEVAQFLNVAVLTPEQLARLQRPVDKAQATKFFTAVASNDVKQVTALLDAHPELISAHDQQGDQA
jgi:hypothetical protein